MVYTATIPIHFGSGYPSLTLEGQLVDTAGANVGAAFTTGFVNLGDGSYLWTGSIPDGHRGGVKFYPQGGSTPVAATAINPEDLENLDVKVSTRASQTSLDTLDDYVDTEVAAIKAQTDQLNFTGTDVVARLSATGVQAVWDALTAALTTVGSIGKLIVTNLDAKVSTRGSLGAGSAQHTHTVTNGAGGPPIDGVEVWVTTDNNPSGNVVASGASDALGQVTFYLDPGTYYLWQAHAGYSFTNPQTITVS